MGDRLKDKIAAVTGAGRGIGRGVAIALAVEGAKVVVNDLGGATDGSGDSKGPADDVVAEIKKAGGDAVANYENVATLEGGENIIKQAVDTYGQIDILVNDAVSSQLSGSLLEMTDLQWDDNFRVNVKGSFYCIKAVVPHMMERRYGKIISMASIVGRRGSTPPTSPAYAGSKGAVIALTASAARELGPHNINVNAVAPGSTLTEGTKGLFYSQEAVFQDKAQRLLDHIPLGRPGDPEDIAHAVLFLASEAAGYITGNTLVVDGGWTAGGYARDF